MKFTYENKQYDVEILKKNNKNIYIRVKDDLKIYVTTPKNITTKEITNLLEKSKSDIIKMINKQVNKNKSDENRKDLILGEKINIIYCNAISKPIFENNRLLIKDSKMFDKWYKQEAIKLFNDRLKVIHENILETVPYPDLKVRFMKTRWGVCNRKNNSITLNLELFKYPLECTDYVITHELVHFIHFNHSANYWSYVGKYFPDYKRVRKILKE